MRILTKIHEFLYQVKNAVIYLINHYKYKFISLFYCFRKLQDKIVFVNFNGRGYGCNPKYIADEIIKQKLNYDLVWLLEDMNNDIPSQIRKVKFFSKQSYYELATAKVIINNVKGELNFIKRKNQLYIQTWHAPQTPKQIEKAAKKYLPFSYILESKNNSKITDIIISSSKMQTQDYIENFWLPKKCEILEIGLPRNDIYFDSNIDQIYFDTKKKLNIPNNTKILLLAPTFRNGDDSLYTYGYDIKKLYDVLNANRQGEWIILLKMHPNVKLNNLKYDGVKDVSFYPNLQNLVIICDILITDYSTTMFDGALLNKEVHLYLNDIDEYTKIRNLKPMMFDLKFPVSRTEDELYNNIINFDKNEYLKSLEEIKQLYLTYDNGLASYKIVNYIKKWISSAGD